MIKTSFDDVKETMLEVFEVRIKWSCSRFLLRLQLSLENSKSKLSMSPVKYRCSKER